MLEEIGTVPDVEGLRRHIRRISLDRSTFTVPGVRPPSCRGRLTISSWPLTTRRSRLTRTCEWRLFSPSIRPYGLSPSPRCMDLTLHPDGPIRIYYLPNATLISNKLDRDRFSLSLISTHLIYISICIQAVPLTALCRVGISLTLSPSCPHT